MIRRLAAIAAFMLLLSSYAGSALAQNTLRQDLNAGRVTIITGGFEYVNSTYMRLAGEMAAVTDEMGELRLLPVMGQGPVENIRDILYLQGIDIGVLHSDALTFVVNQEGFPRAREQLRFLAKLYDELFHFIAHRSINSVYDLAGKKVVVGKNDYAGSTISALTVFDLLGIEVEAVYDSWESAVKRIKDGEVAAMLYSTVRGSGFVQSIKPADQLHLLPLPFNGELAETYQLTQFTAVDYPNLIVPGRGVDTLQFATVMAAYNWDPNHGRYANVTKFMNKLFDNVEKLKAPPFHERWVNFDPAAEPPPGWTRFPAVQAWVTANPPKPKKVEPAKLAGADQKDLQQEFELFLDYMKTKDRIKSKNGMSQVSDKELEDLFRNFVTWKYGQSQ